MIIKLLLILLAFYCSVPLLSAEDTIPITILYTSGNKGSFLPSKIYESLVFKDLDIKIGDRYGGYAAIAHYIHKTREEVEAKEGIFLLIDGGNSLVGSSEANFFQGRVSIDFMNRMGYNSITVANLDWSLGVDNVRELSESSKFTFLNANILIKGTNQHPPYLKPYIIVEAGGLKIGIIGYVQHDLSIWLDPTRVKGLVGHPAIPIVQKYIEEMREKGAVLIIAMDHTASDNYRNTALLTEGIDVLIDGSAGWDGFYVGKADLYQPEKIKNTYVFPEVDSTFAVGRIDLNYDRKKRRIYATHFERYFMNLKEVEENPEIKKFAGKYADIYFEVLGKKLLEVVGYATGDLTTVWDKDWNAPLGTLVCEAMRQFAGTDVGIQNLGSIRRHLKKGPIRVRDVQDALPFKNNLVTFKVKGIDIYRFHYLTYYHDSKPPIPGIYTSGMKITRTPEMMIKHITIGKKEIQDDRDYTFATNSYIYNAGYLKNYGVCGGFKIWENKVADIVVDYIKERSPISPSGREVGTYVEY
jgi:2',3'-cyclic-nucleotide 2'-phosphodiesterase (5'-nucleotidase family)